jgi:hypothetical protein
VSLRHSQLHLYTLPILLVVRSPDAELLSGQQACLNHFISCECMRVSGTISG